MRAYIIAIYILSLNLGFVLFVTTINLAGTSGDPGNPGYVLSTYLPDEMRIIDQGATTDPDDRTWNESIDYYAKYNYSELVESEAEAQSSTWGNILKALQVVVGIIKFGVFGIFIMVNAALKAGGVAEATRWGIALLFQTGTYAIYGIGLAQYIRGSGMKGYE